MVKKAFLLTEVLLALALLELCLIPLIKQPIRLYRSQIESLHHLELERMADWSFTEIKEIFLKNQIPWGKIPQKGKPPELFSLPDLLLEFPGFQTKSIQRKFSVQTTGHKKGKNRPEYKQLRIFVFLEGKKYEFRLSIQKIV